MIRKKLAFIGHSYVESSSRTKLAYIAQQMDVRLITPSWFPMPFGRYDVDFEFNSELPVRSYPIGFLNVRRTTTRWFLYSRDLDFADFQPDIIHVDNEVHSWIMCQTLLYRKLYAPKAKVVVFTWDNLYRSELGTKGKALEPLARLNCRSVDSFMTGNSSGRDVLLARGIPADKIEVIPQFGVDSNIFFPFSDRERKSIRAELGFAPEELAIGYVGKFMEEKGIFDLIDAVGLLRKETQLKLVLVLMGKGDLEEELRSRCADLGLRVIMPPARKNDRVAQVMNAMDVLVLPTYTKPPIKEQFGRVLIEAMACGIPVIGSSCGEIPNVIGDAGLVFQERNVGELVKCLSVCCDPGFRAQMTQRGLSRVAHNYTTEKIAERTLRIYERVCGTELLPESCTVGRLTA